MANDVHQLTNYFQMNDQFSENVLHFEANKANSVQPGTDADDCMGGFIATLLPDMLGLIPTAVTYLGSRCKRINNGGGPTRLNTGSNAPGTRTGALSSTVLAPLLTFPISTGLKFVTGKLFLPGISVDDITENILETALLAAMEAWGALLQGGFTQGGTTFAYGIWRRLPKTFVKSVILSTASDLIGSQRRRKVPSI